MKAKLLLQLEGRDTVEVMHFDAEHGLSGLFSPRMHTLLRAALTVEVREFLAEDDPETARESAPVHEDEDRRRVVMCPHGNERAMCTDEMCYLIERAMCTDDGGKP